MSKEITPREVERRAELLFTALELLYAEPEKEMLHKDFLDLLKTAPNAIVTCGALVKHDVIATITNGRKPAIVRYVGVAPNLLVCKKIVDNALKESRKHNVKHRAKKANNKSIPVAELTAVSVKPAPLQYQSFLKELAILKERYKQTVPNADIEITVKVSSLANV